MKKSGLILMFILISNLHYSQQDLNSTLSNIIYSQYQSQDWAIAIEEQKISSEDLESAFTLYKEQLSSQAISISDEHQLKKAFLETYIQQHIITKKAFEEKIFEDPKIQNQLKVMLIQNVYQIYLNYTLGNSKPDLEPASEEINQFFEANKDQLLSMGLTASQLQQTIANELSKKKLGLWLNDVVNKTKESYRIKRNDQLLKKLGYEE